MKNFEKVNQSNIFLYHVIEKLIFYKFIIFWRILKSSKMNSDFPPTANAQPSKKAYSLYLWPRSKCWIRASRASIQHAATKVTNIGNKLSSKASPLLRKSELLYIRDKISYNDIKYYFAFLQKDRESGV